LAGAPIVGILKGILSINWFHADCIYIYTFIHHHQQSAIENYTLFVGENQSRAHPIKLFSQAQLAVNWSFIGKKNVECVLPANIVVQAFDRCTMDN
jgi:hypothetical protein